MLHGLSSSCGKWELFSSCGEQASHCSRFFACGSMGSRVRGLSSCGSQTLEHRLNRWYMGFSYSGACGIFPDQGSNPCLLHIGRWFPCHWATRETLSSSCELFSSGVSTKCLVYSVGFLSLAGGNSNELWPWVGLPWWLVGKESTCIVGDLGLIPELGRPPGEGNSYPLQYSGLENSMDRGAWQATVHGVAKSRTGLSDFHFHWPYGSSGNCLFYHSNSSFFGSCSWSSLLKIGLCFPYALQIGIQPNT